MTYQKKRRIILKLATAALSVIGLGFGPGLVSANAATVENLGTFRFWTAWKGDDNSGVMCYISSQPQETLPANVNRDPIHFLVVNRKGLGTLNEVQTLVGYPLASDSTPQVSVDGRGFDMVVEGSAAWLASANDEKPFVDAMKSGTQMIVKGRSQRGTNTTDTYSLLGVTAAMEKIGQACN
ncbi:MAG: invasion associated locus B family protein [Devosiaceae bacterium]|nr:invasion associated locus B family protein [Devosiaceae bacterium]